MRTMRKINKPIKFFGLSSGQFAIFMLLTAIIIIVSIFKQLHPILIIGIISAILFLFINSNDSGSNLVSF